MKCRGCYSKTKFLIKTRKLKIVQCTRCGLIQLSNKPKKNWKKQYRAYMSQDTLNNIQDYVIADHWPLTGNALLNYFEHFPDIKLALDSIPSTILYIEVPNFDRAIETQLVTEFFIEHLVYFTQETLQRTLEINGWSVDAIWIQEKEETIACRAHKRPFLDLSWVNKKKIKEPDFAYAVWGAGHHATAALELFKWKPQLIIDSDSNKWGNIINGIEVKSPDCLKNLPVIVICSGYSEEIASNLSDSYILKADGIYKMGEFNVD